MDLGHGFIPRLDARNYKAVERCLARDGPGMFHEGLDLPWVIVEGPWAVDRGTSTLELCRARGWSYLVDTQAWRYHDPRTFEVEKFATTPSAPRSPSAVPTPEPFDTSSRLTSPSRPPSAQRRSCCPDRPTQPRRRRERHHARPPRRRPQGCIPRASPLLRLSGSAYRCDGRRPSTRRRSTPVAYRGVPAAHPREPAA